MATSVERLNEEFSAACNALEQLGETSSVLNMQNQWAKALVLSAASYFENRICNVIVDVVRVPPYAAVREFVYRQGLARKYHTLFDWKKSNVNKFLGLFGPDFAENAKRSLEEDSSLETSMRDFVSLGRIRNELVHQDYAGYSLDSTADEMLQKFHSAVGFVDWFEGAIAVACAKGETSPPEPNRE